MLALLWTLHNCDKIAKGDPQPRGNEVIECQVCRNEVRKDRAVVWDGYFVACEGHTRQEILADGQFGLLVASAPA